VLPNLAPAFSVKNYYSKLWKINGTQVIIYQNEGENHLSWLSQLSGKNWVDGCAFS
jgi:hypothetical protein